MIRDATYKLPSYASCLRAHIRPKNFTALKGYYELLAKDQAMAKVNEKRFFNEALNKLQKRANTPMDHVTESDKNSKVIIGNKKDLYSTLDPVSHSR